ncbi:hypothetical protein CONPUDRAFT_142800 [Coniophora puteana RWD-64-598 SS2]|uniref:Uncharacterized protein n=1 Tax=Coniophora puteana (strain RWD-64-598) TaxID=741705 RepID=A0A5M3MZL9_CONPW|nr:uncharacterized protein CONPUDRAFT_142800 [Coniophora puteana RWD-64-598 SS2]EIW84578.1 hypothetical protein CONPUDRAFT_142800 [Coniophora puteana RWD-64-598 SS2]
MSEDKLTEQYIQDAFHRYLRSSLTQAKIEKLVDPEILASAEGDLMITGPALCLYFAALRCTTNPPSVPLPRTSKTAVPMELAEGNCPESFLGFLSVWATTVPRIQALAPQHQHDLARIICNLQPISSPLDNSIGGLAADLRAVAIEISQRRSFQNRYADDLQAALDAGAPGGASTLKVKASFVPPPSYEMASPTGSTMSLPRSPSPALSILPDDAPAIELIRETLYAALADVLERSKPLHDMMQRDPSRAYFAAVSFAILDVATTSVTSEGSVVGVLGRELTLAECPPPLKPFMSELAAIGRKAREMEEEDTETAMQYAQRGDEADIPLPRLERARAMIEGGVGNRADRERERDGRRSVEGRAVEFSNRVNALGLGITKLKAFRERQNEVFKVLSSIGA